MLIVTTYLHNNDKLHESNACVHFDFRDKGYGLCIHTSTELFVSTTVVSKPLKDDEHYAPIRDISHS